MAQALCHLGQVIVWRAGFANLSEEDSLDGPLTYLGQVLVDAEMGEDPPLVGGTVDNEEPGILGEQTQLMGRRATSEA